MSYFEDTNLLIQERGWNIPLWTHEEWYGKSGKKDPIMNHSSELGVSSTQWRQANSGLDRLILCAGMKIVRLTRWQLDHIDPKSVSDNHHHTNIRPIPAWLNNRMSDKGWSHEVVEETALTPSNWPLFTVVPSWFQSLPVEQFLDIIPPGGLLS